MTLFGFVLFMFEIRRRESACEPVGFAGSVQAGLSSGDGFWDDMLFGIVMRGAMGIFLVNDKPTSIIKIALELPHRS